MFPPFVVAVYKFKSHMACWIIFPGVEVRRGWCDGSVAPFDFARRRSIATGRSSILANSFVVMFLLLQPEMPKGDGTTMRGVELSAVYGSNPRPS